MIQGVVGSDARARFALPILGQDGSELAVTVVFDSGYDGWLTLPRALAETHCDLLPPQASLDLADGTTRRVRSFRAVLALDGEIMEVDVLELDGEPLAGMQLLSGFRLTMDIVPDGPVVIERLP